MGRPLGGVVSSHRSIVGGALVPIREAHSRQDVQEKYIRNVVSVVIPTFNSRSLIAECVSSVLGQDSPLPLHITVVDGGSTDGTVEVAKGFGVTVLVAPGCYSDGLQGAKELGRKAFPAEFVWFVDSDNIIDTPSTLRALLASLLEDERITVAIPQLCSDPRNNHLLGRVIESAEIARIQSFVRRLSSYGSYFRFNAYPLGIPNCSLFRMSVLDQIGGFDNDQAVAHRMERLGVMTGAFVPAARYRHLQNPTVQEYVRKQRRRLERFANMNRSELESYFHVVPPTFVKDPHKGLREQDAVRNFVAFFTDVLRESASHPAQGGFLLGIHAWAALPHMRSMMRVFGGFLGYSRG